MAGRPATHDEFLAGIDEPARSALQKLREQIRAAAPDAEEYMGYGVPAFRQNGALVSYAAAKSHLSFYIQSPQTLEAFADRLTGFKTSKGSISFQPDKPIPATLVRQLVKARLAENAALRGKKK
jgi:uncharacterized protein YdhG (YjbR/CyaY superfamily)